jgi:hypothetical protein
MLEERASQLMRLDAYTLILMDEGVEFGRIETSRSLIMLALPRVAVGMTTDMKRNAADSDRVFRLTKTPLVPKEWFERCLRRLLAYSDRPQTYWFLFSDDLELKPLMDRAEQLWIALLMLYVLSDMNSNVPPHYESCLGVCFNAVAGMEPGLKRLKAYQEMYEVFTNISPIHVAGSLDILLHYGLEHLHIVTPECWDAGFLRVVLTYALDIKARDGTPFVPLFCNDAPLTYQWLFAKQKDGSLTSLEQRWLSLLIERRVMPLGNLSGRLLSLSDHRAANEEFAQVLCDHLDMLRGKPSSGTVRAVYQSRVQRDHEAKIGAKRSSDFDFYGRTIRVVMHYTSGKLTLQVRLYDRKAQQRDHYRVTVFYFDSKDAKEVTFWAETIDKVTEERKDVGLHPVTVCPRGTVAGHTAALLWVQIEYSVVDVPNDQEPPAEYDSDDEVEEDDDV